MSMIRANVRATGLMGGDLGFAAAVCSQGSFARSTSSGNVDNPQIGESWQVNVQNSPASVPVTLLVQTPQGNTSTVVGYTDSSGTFSQSGQFVAAQVGPQTWNWLIGSKPIGSWRFNLRQPSDFGHVSPAALLKPMPTIIPAKPGQVSSSQMGWKCNLDSWVNGNPVMATGLAIGIGLLLKGKR